MTKRGLFWWKDIFSFVNEYRSITRSQVQGGSSTLFWKDFWTKGDLLCHKFPRLFSYALDDDISVAKMASFEQLNSGFALPLSFVAF
jgi:hypothetical protein